MNWYCFFILTFFYYWVTHKFLHLFIGEINLKKKTLIINYAFLVAFVTFLNYINFNKDIKTLIIFLLYFLMSF